MLCPSSSQYRALHRGRTRGRHHCCRSDFLDVHDPEIGKSIITANILRFLCFLETLLCRVRRAWRFGTKTWSRWWKWRSMWDFADVAPSRQVRSRLYRRGIRVNYGLSTCTRYGHLLSLVIEAKSDPVIVNRLPFLVRLPDGSRRLESAASVTALPDNTGQHTLQHPMMTSTLQAILVLVQHSPRVTLTSVIRLY